MTPRTLIFQILSPILSFRGCDGRLPVCREKTTKPSVAEARVALTILFSVALSDQPRGFIWTSDNLFGRARHRLRPRLAIIYDEAG